MFSWHHRWNVLGFTLLLQMMVYGIITFSFPFWIVAWLDEFKVPRSELMLIVSIQVFIGGFISPFCGIALDKYGARMAISAGTLFFAISILLISMADSHWEILVLYTSLCFSMTVCGQLGCQSVVSRWFTHKRGTALGISTMGSSIGGLIMPPIATAMLAAFGWRETFQLLSMAILVLLLPTSWIVLGRKPEENGQAEQKGTAAVAEPERWTTARLLRDRDFWIVVVCFCAVLMVYLPVVYSLGLYAKDLGISQQKAAWIASAGAVALGAGKFAFGKLADRFEVKPLYWSASAGLVVSVVVMSVAGSWFPLMAAVVILSFCFGCNVPLSSMVVVNRFGAASFGRVLGLIMLFTQLSSVSPYLAGLIQEFSSSYIAAFAAMSSPILLAMFAMRFLSVRPTWQ